MSGFMSTSTALTVCKADLSKFDIDKLRQHAFSDTINADGCRSGWVGLGDMVDNEDFVLALASGNYAGFSWRVDAKKPVGAAVKLKLAEAIKAEIAECGKITGKRKKELKTRITEEQTAKADFTPTVTDCIADLGNGRFYIGSASPKVMEAIIVAVKNTFGIDLHPVFPEGDMQSLFASLVHEGAKRCGDFAVATVGSANLASPDGAEQKVQVAVQNYEAGASVALADGLNIKKLQVVATPSDDVERQLSFTIDPLLSASGLKLPKPEKDVGDDATFIINADTCSQVADVIECLAKG